MATHRYISTSFWMDKWVRTLDPSERYLYIYLLTNPETNIAGVYQITIDRIAFDTGYDERTLLPMLERFRKTGKTLFFEDEWMIIPAWPKHQQLTPENNCRKGIDRILKSLPDEVFNALLEFGYKYPYINELGRALQAPYKGLTSPSNYSDSDSDSDFNSKTRGAIPEDGNLPLLGKLKKSRTFKPPELQEVADYCKERKNGVTPSAFIDFYTAKGWMVGKNKMKDWKAAVRTWEQRNPNTSKQINGVTVEDATCPYCKGKIVGTAGFCSRCGWRTGDDITDPDNIEFYECKLLGRVKK